MLKQTQPSTLKEGHPPPRQDQVATLLDRKPHWPCQPCGSPNHWDKECPYYNLFNQLRSRLVKSVYKGTNRPQDIKNVYHSTYQPLLMQTVSQLYVHSSSSEDSRMAEESLLAIHLVEEQRGSSCSVQH